MSFEPRISIVTLGVASVAASRAFYERLGFIASKASQDSICFMQLGGQALALYSRASLADDAHVANSPPGFSGVTLAYNCRTEAAVDAAIAHAVACGATLKKPAQKVFWGGYSGYVADPDGHLWEVAHNPFVTLDAEGRLQLPSAIEAAHKDQNCL
jgi:uncharacterized protein